ncbi:uncharacterized protein BJ212DRAFT_1300684 [Suillus subaureus]|uniref:Uncharacterized protein n=1 Tax=Suillus subaureus TaxID=48587 RepID=A0A9P7E9J8_9AGAM|nr:uncharacterized protein BJ212DRAFT_1300684 [Suillus subaureus]KAG1814394.1 hypothetical protein BJ212DRAFT_1300684 [Suillus subaureus]
MASTPDLPIQHERDTIFKSYDKNSKLVDMWFRFLVTINVIDKSLRVVEGLEAKLFRSSFGRGKEQKTSQSIQVKVVRALFHLLALNLADDTQVYFASRGVNYSRVVMPESLGGPLTPNLQLQVPVHDISYTLRQARFYHSPLPNQILTIQALQRMQWQVSKASDIFQNWFKILA